MEQAYHTGGTDDERAISDMIVIAFFILVRQGEYTGTASDDTPFQLHDVNLYVQGHHLDVLTASDTDIGSVAST
jgi:hypothetical protein